MELGPAQLINWKIRVGLLKVVRWKGARALGVPLIRHWTVLLVHPYVICLRLSLRCLCFESFGYSWMLILLYPTFGYSQINI